MKKRIIALAVVAICLSVLASTTLAYFTDSAVARNVIASGGVSIEIVEQQLVDGALQPYAPMTVPVMPATTVSKIVSVQSKEQAAWIRVSLDVTIYDAEGNVMELTDEEIASVVIIDIDSDAWTLQDGKWYCNASAKAGELTAPLFEQVAFSGANMDNRFQGCTVVIDIAAEAVQTANNGANVLEAMGWPEVVE